MRNITIDQFLSKDQIKKAIELKEAKAICEKIIKPNIEKINLKLGQENDPMYLSYAVRYVLFQQWGLE